MSAAAHAVSHFLKHLFKEARAVRSAAGRAQSHADAAGLSERLASDAAAGAERAEEIAMHAAYGTHSNWDPLHSAFGGPLPASRLNPAWEASSAWSGSADEYGMPLASAVGQPFVPRPSTSSSSDLKQSKELVDSVIVLMQQLTHSLQSALYQGSARCPTARRLVLWYQAQMSRYHVEGQALAAGLSDQDMALVEQYAQAQVASFSSDLEQAVSDASSLCGMATSQLLPDVPASQLPQPQPLSLASSRPVLYSMGAMGQSVGQGIYSQPLGQGLGMGQTFGMENAVGGSSFGQPLTAFSQPMSVATFTALAQKDHVAVTAAKVVLLWSFPSCNASSFSCLLVRM